MHWKNAGYLPYLPSNNNTRRHQDYRRILLPGSRRSCRSHHLIPALLFPWVRHFGYVFVSHLTQTGFWWIYKVAQARRRWEVLKRPVCVEGRVRLISGVRW